MSSDLQNNNIPNLSELNKEQLLEYVDISVFDLQVVNLQKITDVVKSVNELKFDKEDYDYISIFYGKEYNLTSVLNDRELNNIANYKTLKNVRAGLTDFLDLLKKFEIIDYKYDGYLPFLIYWPMDKDENGNNIESIVLSVKILKNYYIYDNVFGLNSEVIPTNNDKYIHFSLNKSNKKLSFNYTPDKGLPHGKYPHSITSPLNIWRSLYIYMMLEA